jgi:hypothetical protein
MSAPLVVNTRDGVCWTRRTVTSGGIALYAPESVKTCPDFVMATEAELAEHGIVGSAYALPMPVGPGPVVRPLALDEAQVDALAASGNRAVNDLVHEDLCACDAWPEKCLSSGGFFQGYWDWGYLETAIPAVLGLWESMRGGELERLRARVAELEAAAKEIQRLHTDSPMGPCPVCIDGDAMVRGDDYTLPYPCPTARLAGAKDCDPPSQRQASHLPAEGGDAR